jgi:colanic acid biosynthesis protein WcaH
MIPEAEYRSIVDKMPIVCIDAVIINNKNQYLLVRRNNEPLKGEYWVPGGRLLKNETLDEGAVRIVRQELGIDAHIVMQLGVYEDFFEKNPLNVESGLHTISIIYLMIANDEEVQLDGQSGDWGWFDELPERLCKMISFNVLDGLGH